MYHTLNFGAGTTILVSESPAGLLLRCTELTPAMKDLYVFPRVQVIPQIGRASLCIDGRDAWVTNSGRERRGHSYSRS